ncbi:hypothetical protein J6590_069232 [Homalodisca vitripennis]|nr:hypothetical protein J6590_069232 [Homalodisca vitripennis]
MLTPAPVASYLLIILSTLKNVLVLLVSSHGIPLPASSTVLVLSTLALESGKEIVNYYCLISKRSY